MNVFTYMHQSSARFLAALAVFTLLMGMIPFQAFAQAAPEHAKPIHCEQGYHLEGETCVEDINPNVTLCHATESGTNPYNLITTDAKSIVNLPNGHDDHDDGGIDDLGDIIPPFDYNFGDGLVHYPGSVNWDDPDILAIWDNDCEVPDEPPVDMCPNIEGDQPTIPEGMIKDKSGNCVPPPVDVCPNIEGDQAEVPDGMIKNEGGQCVPDERPTVDVTLCKIDGTDAKLGGWTLKLGAWEVVTALEGESMGCAVVEEVPFDDYMIDEVMLSDRWINLTGEGVVAKGASVEVNEQNHLFILKNHECAENELVRDNQCVPVEDGNEIITMCKYDDGNEDAPIAGWGMLLTNDTEAGTFELVTGENGCVSQEVDPDAGPWWVIEEARADWTQEDVVATGGAVMAGQGADICTFFPELVVDTFSVETAIVIDPTYRCEFYNSEDDSTPDPVCRIGNNLLQNGSFEDPVVTDHGGTWEIFASVTDWVISLSDGLELWRGLGIGPSDGEQNAELDGNDATRITQTVTTTPGATYELRFDFAARTADAADNNMNVLLDGATMLNVSTTDMTWNTHAVQFMATSSSVDIGFEDIGTPQESGGTGSLLDNAILCLVEEPEPAEACMLTIISDTTNTVTELGDANAVLAWTHGNWITSLTDSVASWIWGSEYVADPATTTTQTFVKTFGWSGPVTSALLDIATDNTYVVKINGVEVAADATPDNFSAADEDIDVASHIVTGMNTIEIAVTNIGVEGASATQNPAGLLYNLTIVGNTEDDCSYTDDGGGGGDPELSCSLSANDTSIRRGDDIVLSWQTTNATLASLNQSIGNLASSSLPNGSRDVANVLADTVYTMTVWDEEENSVTCDVRVDVSSGGGGGRRSTGTRVAGDSDEAPTPQVLGEQVSVVPLGAADAGAGGAAPLTFPSAGLAAVAFLAGRKQHA